MTDGSPCLVTLAPWRDARGRLHTTVVGKVTQELGPDGSASLVVPDPIATFDRIGPDDRFITEASEIAPFTTASSVVLEGGPLRFTLEKPNGSLVATRALDTPVGYSISSPERAAFAKSPLTRDSDGVLRIPDGFDARAFVAAPSGQTMDALRGDERYLFESTQFRAQSRLSGAIVVVTLRTETGLRVVALTPDLVVVNERTRRVSVVSRAVIAGAATVVGQAVSALGQPLGTDRGDVPDLGSPGPLTDETAVLDEASLSSRGAAKAAARASFHESEETRDLSDAEISELVASSRTPFPGAAAEAPRAATHVPATPFDAGFTPAPIIPADGVTSTLTPDEQMAKDLAAMRAALRKAPPAEAAPSKEPEPLPPPRVAPPVPGAMAKPRFKPR